jgi:hypothetical protein
MKFDFPMEIAAMDDAVVSKTGYTYAKKAAELNFHAIRSYAEILCNVHICCGWDPFEADEIRRTNHNTIAAAFNIPRKLVSVAAEDVFSIYLKSRNKSDDFRRDDLSVEFAVQKFIERLVEVRYEVYVERKWQEFVEKIANTWVEKDFESLTGIPKLSN